MERSYPQAITALELQQWLQGEQPPLLVDVREHQELALAAFPGDVIHLPLSESQTWIDVLSQRVAADQPVVVICHAGVTAMAAPELAKCPVT